MNFEGRVTSVENGKVTLEDGTIVCTDDAEISAPDGSAVEIAVGNYIQGHAEGPDYEFSTFEDCAKYLKACGHPQPEPWRTSYGRGSGGSFSAEYTTLEDGKVLHIDCKRYRYLTVLTNFLLEKYPEDFSKLKDCFPPSTTSESPTAYFDGSKRKLYCETLSPSDKKAA